MASLNTPTFPDTQSRFHRLIHGLEVLEDGCLVFLLATLVVVTAGQVLLRNLFGAALPWGDQLPRVLVLWLGLAGAMAASRHHRHINMDVLSRWLQGRAKELNSALTGFFTAGVSALLAYSAIRFVVMDYEAQFRAFGFVPLWVAELVLPVGFGVIGLRYFLHALSALSRLWHGGVEE